MVLEDVSSQRAELFNVLLTPKGPRPEGVRVGKRDLIDNRRTVSEDNLDSSAVRLLSGVNGEIPTGPLGVFHRGDLFPQLDRVGARRSLVRVRVNVVPGPVLERHRKYVGQRVVERLPRRVGVVLLRIVRTRADDEVRVIRGVDDDARNTTSVEQVWVLVVELARKIDPRLCLVLSGVLFREAFKNGALGLAVCRQRDGVSALGTVKKPRDNAVFPFVDRRRRRLTSHCAVNGFDGDLAGERRGVRLPRGNLALARLPSGRRRVECLTNRLVDRLLIKTEQCAESRRDTGS